MKVARASVRSMATPQGSPGTRTPVSNVSQTYQGQQQQQQRQVFNQNQQLNAQQQRFANFAPQKLLDQQQQAQLQQRSSSVSSPVCPPQKPSSIWDPTNCCPIPLTPLCGGLFQVYEFCVDYGFVLNPNDDPFRWGFSVDPQCGYLRIPEIAAIDLGFITRPPRKEDSMLIANFIDPSTPIPPTPTNFLPSIIQSSLYSFIGTPTSSYPYWTLKPKNFLTNATQQMSPDDIVNINFGTFKGGRKIRYIDYATMIMWVEQNLYAELIRFCIGPVCDPGKCPAPNRGWNVEFDYADDCSSSESECSTESEESCTEDEWEDCTDDEWC